MILIKIFSQLLGLVRDILILILLIVVISSISLVILSHYAGYQPKQAGIWLKQLGLPSLEEVFVPSAMQQALQDLRADLEALKQQLYESHGRYLQLQTEAVLRDTENSVIAQGHRGDYVRQLACTTQQPDGTCETFRVSFAIKGGGQAEGLIDANTVVEKPLSDNAYAQLIQHSTIELLWEQQLSQRIKNAQIKILGLHIEEQQIDKLELLHDHLLPRLIQQEVRPKILRIENAADAVMIFSDIAHICQRHQIEGLLYIKPLPGRLRIYLYHFTGVILYVANVAFQDTVSVYSDNVRPTRPTN